MSYADFDDIYQICCDWCKGVMSADELIQAQNMFRDGITNSSLQQGNQWWEMAEKEIKEEREKVLM